MIRRALMTGKPKLAYREFLGRRSLTRPAGPLKLHLGCGQRRLEGFINIDHNLSPATDYVCDITILPCKPGTVERIDSYHVIEHIPRPIVQKTLKIWSELLRPGGLLVLECPDFMKDCEELIAGNYERMHSIFGPQRFPGDAHHWGYTVDTLSALLKEVGFSNVASADPQDYHTDIEPCIRVEAIK